MKKFLLSISLIGTIVMFALPLYAGRFFMGAKLGAISTDDYAYTGKNTGEIIANLNGEINEEKNDVFIVGLYEGYYKNEYAAIIFQQRYFSRKISSEFFHQPTMNFEIARNVVPLNAGVRLKINVDSSFGFFFEALPGIYIVDTFEQGYFANYHSRDNYFGFNISVGGDFVFNDNINISLGITYDSFQIDKRNLILEDGGDGGGMGILLNTGVIF